MYNKMERASVRLAVKSIKKKTQNILPVRKKKRIEKLAEKEKVWNAVKQLYNIESGNVSSRNLVSPYFRPRPRKYNASKNKFITGNNANKVIRNSIKLNKNIADILVPLNGNSRGGVDPGYVAAVLNTTNIKYAIVNTNGKLKAIALVKNQPNSRYINVIAGYKSYGHPMMNKVLSNAKAANKRRVNLKAVVQSTSLNKNANKDPLVRWYASKGFKRSGTLNNTGLFPMSKVLFTRSGN